MFDSERFRRAVDLALELHGRQTRKGAGIPYLGHLLGVTSIVIDDGGSETEVIAALLHDGPEDAGGEETLAGIYEAKLGPTALVTEFRNTVDRLGRPD